MENIYYLLGLFLLCWYFIYLRQVSEVTKKHLTRHCEQASLQLITLARRSSSLKLSKKHGLCLYSIFDFEFSGDGESNNEGTVTLYGLKLDNIDLPAYRVN